MTPREFAALERLYQNEMQRWAMERAMFANAHFSNPSDPTWKPWTAEHFLGEVREAPQRNSDAIAAARGVLAMWKGDKDEDVPDWAKRLGKPN